MKTNMLKETVLITGHHGNLAKETKNILQKNYNVRSLTTNKNISNQKSIFYWNIEEKYIDIEALKDCNHIIHLAGLSILKRWSYKNKKLMYESRIGGSKLLFEKCKELHIHPNTFITSSAIGFYGLNNKTIKKEDDAPGNDWVSKMAYDWEEAANEFKKIGSRVVKMRISLLFDKGSGFLKYNLLSMRFGIGGMIGNAQKKINWIHINDAARFIDEAIKTKKYYGAYNLANKEEITQKEIFKAIKKKLFPYSLIIRVPKIIIKLILGKRSLIITNDIVVSSEKLKEVGFKWKYERFEDVLDSY